MHFTYSGGRSKRRKYKKYILCIFPDGNGEELFFPCCLRNWTQMASICFLHYSHGESPPHLQTPLIPGHSRPPGKTACKQRSSSSRSRLRFKKTNFENVYTAANSPSTLFLNIYVKNCLETVAQRHDVIILQGYSSH